MQTHARKIPVRQRHKGDHPRRQSTVLRLSCRMRKVCDRKAQSGHCEPRSVLRPPRRDHGTKTAVRRGGEAVEVVRSAGLHMRCAGLKRNWSDSVRRQPCGRCDVPRSLLRLSGEYAAGAVGRRVGAALLATGVVRCWCLGSRQERK